jgi:hypothetical protein
MAKVVTTGKIEFVILKLRGIEATEEMCLGEAGAGFTNDLAD